MCNEANAASRDLSLVDTLVGKNVMRVVYLTLAASFGSYFLGFSDFAPSVTQLLLIGIGCAAAMGLGLGRVCWRQKRRMSSSAGEIDCEKGSDA